MRRYEVYVKNAESNVWEIGGIYRAGSAMKAIAQFSVKDSTKFPDVCSIMAKVYNVRGE